MLQSQKQKDEWIYFLKNEEIKDTFKAKGFKKAKDELDILKLSDEDRAMYSRYQDDMHLQAYSRISLYRWKNGRGERG